MCIYLKRLIKNNSVILENISYLFILQILNLLLPFLTYPYLMKILGTALFGKVVFAQSIISFFTIVINFGFNISATKNVSLNKDNKVVLSEIISSVFIIKFFLWLFMFTLLVALIYFVPFFSQNKLLFILVFGASFNELFFTQWYFQAIEKMKYITYINFGTRIIYVIFILSFINSPDEYLLWPLINMICFLLAGIYCLYFIFKKKLILFRFQRINTLSYYAKDSMSFFLSSGFVLIKEQTNSILIGAFLGYNEVAYYDFVNKVVNLLKQPFLIIRDAFFPSLVQQSNFRKLNKISSICLVISIIMYFSLLLFSDRLAYLVGKEKLLPSVYLFKYMGVNITLTVLSVFSGMILIIKEKMKLFRNSIIISTILYLLFLTSLYFFDLIDLNSLVIAYVLSLFIEVLIRFWYPFNNKFFS